MRLVLRSLELLAVGLFTCVMTLHAVSRLLAGQVLDGVVDGAFALALLALWRFLYRWLQAQDDAVARGIARAVTDAVVCAYRVERRHRQWGLHNLHTDLWMPLDEVDRLSLADPALLHALLHEED
jgi:hypothetical protein